MRQLAYITNAGLALLARVCAAEGTLRFTRVEVGSGRCATEGECRTRTALREKRGEAKNLTVTREEQRASVRFEYENTGVEQAFALSEYGIYAAEREDGEDALYCYVCFDAEGAERVGPASEGKVLRAYETALYVADAPQVEICYRAPGVVAQDVFDAAVQDLSNRLDRQQDSLSRAIAQGDAALDERLDALEGSVGEVASTAELNAAIEGADARRVQGDQALERANGQLRADLRAEIERSAYTVQTVLQTLISARTTQEDVQRLIMAARHMHIEHVDSLEDVAEPDETALYLVPKAAVQPEVEAAPEDLYYEYIWSGEWERIGSTDIDLSEYVRAEDLVPMTQEELDALLAEALPE